MLYIYFQKRVIRRLIFNGNVCARYKGLQQEIESVGNKLSNIII